MPGAGRRCRPAARAAAALVAALLAACGTASAQEAARESAEEPAQKSAPEKAGQQKQGQARGATRSGEAGAVPLTHLSQVGAAFQSCWRAPPGSAGSRITLRFGLSASGELKGPPRATFSALAGRAEDQRAFVTAALTAIARCTPLVMREDLARVVASRVLTVTFSAPVRGLDI